MGWPFQQAFQVLNVLQVKAGYTVGQERVLLVVGCWLLGQWY